MTANRHTQRPARHWLCAACLLIATDAVAQLRLPTGTPALPTATLPVDAIERTVRDTDSALNELDTRARKNLRALQIRELLRTQRTALEADPTGAPIVRGQIIAVAPTAEALEKATHAGFVILTRHALPGLDIDTVTLAPPPGSATHAALRQLRALDPAGQYDFNHIYTRSDSDEPLAGAATTTSTVAAMSFNPVGLIDSGIERNHTALQASAVQTWGCGERPIPSAHGTAVASLLVGADTDFRGAAPGAPLFAADIYCDEPTGGAATTIAAACAWLVAQRVPVINISLVGPPNALLERVVQTLLARGHLLVAAVGNDGPAGPPLYPAAYPGVVAVTGVDARERVLIEAGRGAHVTFAAPGADMFAATTPASAYTSVRGTSFAAPLVAGLLSRDIGTPDTALAAAALAKLRSQAIDLGKRGSDEIYGHGLVGKETRVTARSGN